MVVSFVSKMGEHNALLSAFEFFYFVSLQFVYFITVKINVVVVVVVVVVVDVVVVVVDLCQLSENKQLITTSHFTNPFVITTSIVPCMQLIGATFLCSPPFTSS